MRTSESKVDLESILRRVREGEIDLQPNFQRGEVWDKRRRQRLIDTILRGWYLPAVQLVVEGGSETESVLDGQQRLVAIRDFFDGQFPVDGSIEPRDEEIAQLDGFKFADLPPNVQRRLRRYEVSQVRLSDYDPAEPSELFFRLNQSYALTPPEKRNALYGAPRDQIRALVARLVSEGLFAREVIGFSNGRLAYDDVIARACVTLEANSLAIHVNNSTVEDRYRHDAPFEDSVIDALIVGAEQLKRQIDNTEQERVKFNKGTLHSWLIFLAVSGVQGDEVPADLLRKFEWDRAQAKDPTAEFDIFETGPSKLLMQVLSIYTDRSSYRVTDMSSVRLRDLCIHAYLGINFAYLATRRTVEAVEVLRSASPRVEATALRFVDESDWGNPLFEGGSR